MGQEVKTIDEVAKSIAPGSYSVYADLTRSLCYKEGSIVYLCVSNVCLILASIACCNIDNTLQRF